MLYLKKEGFPKEGELVYCEVKKVTSNSVFVYLEEYRKEAILPVPEVSPGRIRNLRDYVKLGKKIVCMVLSVNPRNDHIVVSLRRVSEGARRAKMDEIKQELSAEGLINYVANKLKKDPLKLYENIFEKIKGKYATMYEFFLDVVENNHDLSKIIPDKTLVRELKEAIIARIKPKAVEKKVQFVIKIHSGNGINEIKDAFKHILNIDKKRFKIDNIIAKYLGSGMYEVRVTAKDFDYVNGAIDWIVKQMSERFEDKPNIEFSVKVFKGEKIS